MSELYAELGLKKGCSEDDIRRAFRKLSMIHHPDRGGDEEKFKKINSAYEILSNKEKREIYDETGDAAAAASGQRAPRGGMGGMFGDLFGFGGGGPKDRKPPKVRFPLGVTLEDLYQGKTKKIRVTRTKLCTTCRGLGAPKDKISPCGKCKGRGIQIQMRQVGPGMVQQVQSQCGACEGKGSTIPPGAACTACKGKCKDKEKVDLTIEVLKGMEHGENITFSGVGDESVDYEGSADLVVELQCQEHDRFKRVGDNLFLKHKISLLDALTGFRHCIQHLDQRKVNIIPDPTALPINPGQTMVVRGQGFVKRNPTQFGDLYFVFDVVFPKLAELTAEKKDLLKKALPNLSLTPVPVSKESTEDEKVEACDMDEERERWKAEKHQARSEAYDTEGQDEQREGVQCAQQ